MIGAGLLQRLPGALTRPLLAGVVDGTVRPVRAAQKPAARHDPAQVQATLRDSPAGALLTGRKAVVRAAPLATHWLVTACDAAGLLRAAVVLPGAPGIARRDSRLADGGWAWELAFDHTPVAAVLGPADQDLLPRLLQTLDEARLVRGAESLGLMQRLMQRPMQRLMQRRMQDTLNPVRTRRQFGVALASFQRVQHRLADLHMLWLQADALVGATLAAMAGPAARRRRAVASAQVAVARACRSVGRGAVDLHGGIGIINELSVGHAFKRLTLIESHGGGVPAHLRQLATDTAIPEALP